ncbi:MAG: EVE domain-containing protein [Verrucomicrobiales bacterium]
MNYWLFKSEPSVFSFADLRSRGREPWTGVRNYQVRNYMRDAMHPGDEGMFYHSSCPEPGVAGVLRVASEPYPDPTQFDPKSAYFDAKATRDAPIWQLVDVAWARDFKEFVPLATLRADPALQDLVVLRRGNRLSITPIEAAHFKRICRLGGLK